MSVEIDMQALRQVFASESLELLQQVEAALLALEARPGDRELVAEIFRHAHSIKGNARIVGYERLADFVHAFEDRLQALRAGLARATPALTTLLLRAVDALRGLTPQILERGEGALDAVDALLAELRAGDQERAAANAAPADDPCAPELPADTARRDLRVGLDKLDRLMALVGEIAIARGRLNEALGGEQASRASLLEAHHESDQLYLDLQECVMRMRMLPLGPLLRTFARTVRDLGLEAGKDIRLEIEGEEVEVDLTVVDQLRDPLAHLIRNAVYHGIEAPARRREAGKPSQGLLRLRAQHLAGQIVVSVEDDGAGIDRQRLIERARQQRLIAPDAQLDDQQALRLVFTPGLSTAEQVSEAAGRGVGMDVVLRNVERLRGRVDLSSTPGQGTAVDLRLPLTLAIIEGFRVSASGEQYIIPVEAIVECLELPAAEGARQRPFGVFTLRERPLAYVHLGSFLGLRRPAASRENVVVVQHGELRAGLVVDQLLGEAQTVIKPLHRLFQGAPGLAGSAILGNGRVAFVLDVPGLLREVLERSAAATAGRDLEAQAIQKPDLEGA